MKNLPTLPIKRGEFVALEAAGGTIGAGESGTLRTITPPAGQRVRVTHLSTIAAGNTSVSQITLVFGSTTILSSATIGSQPQLANRYAIGSYQPYNAGVPPFGSHKYITGKVDEAFTVTAGTSTATILYYAYEFGE